MTQTTREQARSLPVTEVSGYPADNPRPPSQSDPLRENPELRCTPRLTRTEVPARSWRSCADA